MNDAYRQLIEQFCRSRKLKPLDDPNALLTLIVEDVLFFISPIDDGDGVRVQITVHYGELPEDAPPLACRRLLEANVQFFDSTQPRFGLDTETGSVIATGTLVLASLTAESLTDLVTLQTAMVTEWRDTFFLTSEERAPSRAPSRADAGGGAQKPASVRPRPFTLGR